MDASQPASPLIDATSEHGIMSAISVEMVRSTRISSDAGRHSEGYEGPSRVDQHTG